MAPITALIARGTLAATSSVIESGEKGIGICDSTECAVGISVAVGIIVLLLLLAAAYKLYRKSSPKDGKTIAMSKSDDEGHAYLSLTQKNNTDPISTTSTDGQAKNMLDIRHPDSAVVR